MNIIITLILLILNLVLLYKALNKKSKTEVIKAYIHLLIFTCISSLALLLKLILIKFNITNLFILEPFIYLSKYMVPVSLLIITLMFVQKKQLTYKELLPIYIPNILMVLFIALNPLHTDFFIKYSCFDNELIFGKMYYILTLYIYMIYIIIAFIIVYESFNYIEEFPVECILFTIVNIFSILLDATIIFILKDFDFNASPIIISLYTLTLYDTIIKHIHITNLAFNIQFILDKLASPLVLIDNLGNIKASNKAFDDVIDSIYKGKGHTNNFYEIVKEISSPHYNILKALVQKSIVKKKTITKEFSFTFKKKTFTYLINISAVTKKKFKNLLRKFVRLSHSSTLLLFNDLESIKNQELTMKRTEMAIDTQSQLATVGELAAGVAHDINTPISAIKTAISILKSYDLTDAEKATIAQMESSAEKITEVSTSIRDQFRNMGLSKKEVFSFNLLMSSIIKITKSTLSKNNVKLYLDVDPDISLYGIPAKLSQVILNILNNSIEAYETCHSIDTSIIILKAYKGKKNLVISIEDYAGGIPRNLKPYLFKHILNTKGADGFGLGLYISNLIIRNDFNGKITCNSKDNQTEIKISIPLVTDKFMIHNDDQNKSIY